MSKETCTNCGELLKEIRVERLHSSGKSHWIPFDTDGKCMKCSGWMVSDSTPLITFGNGIDDKFNYDERYIIHIGDDKG